MARLFTLIVFLLVVNQAHAQEPTIEHIGHYNIDDLNQILADFNAVGLILPEHEVDAYKITYTTPHPSPDIDTTVVTGAIVVPADNPCNVPMAAYMHGTTFNNNGVPSYGSDELKIGLVYSSLGVVTTLPDYIGLGDSPGIHPYHHAESTATCAEDLMRVARDYSDDLGGYTLNDQLFIFGYSQGGHAAMALHRHIQETLDGEFVVTASHPMSGAYDLSETQAEYSVFSCEPYATPGYLPYIIFGLNEVYQLFDDAIEVFVEPYATIFEAMFAGDAQLGDLNGVSDNIAKNMLQPDVLEEFQTNPESPFYQAFAQQNVYDWAPTSPIRLIYCTEDEQVYYENAIVAYNTMIENGADPDLIEIVNGGAVSHGDCIGAALASGITFFNSFIELNSYIFCSPIVTNASDSLVLDGSIILNSSGGEGGLTYNWETGQTGPVIENLEPGEYLVTISDAVGCSVVDSYIVGVGQTSTTNLVKELGLYPNPASESVTIDLPAPYTKATLTLSDITGKEVFKDSDVFGKTYQLNIDNFPAGAYFAALHSDRQKYVSKLIIH